MYKVDPNYREKIVMPIPVSGMYFMILGVIMYTISVLGSTFLSLSFPTVGVTNATFYLYVIFLAFSLTGMVMFILGSTMQIYRLVKVIKAMQHHFIMNNFERE